MEAIYTLYLTMWNKVLRDMDYFIGQVLIPISTVNISSEDISQWYCLTSEGMMFC